MWHRFKLSGYRQCLGTARWILFLVCFFWANKQVYFLLSLNLKHCRRGMIEGHIGVINNTHNKKSKTFALKFDKSMFCATFSGHTEYIKYFYSWLSFFLPLAVKRRCWNFQWAPNFILSFGAGRVAFEGKNMLWAEILLLIFYSAVRLRTLCDFSSLSSANREERT